MTNSKDLPFPPRPQLSSFLYVGIASLIALLMIAWYVLEYFFGYSFRGRGLEFGEDPLTVGIGVVTVIVFAIVAAVRYLRERDLMVNGKEVTATVSRIGTIAIREMLDIVLTFEWNGSIKANRKSVAKSFAASLKVGASVHLLVLPSNPDRFLIIEEYGPNLSQLYSAAEPSEDKT